jgi:hypothetical protein
VYYPGHEPLFCVTRDLHEYEKEDPKNKGLKGVKTFYFNGYHYRGQPSLFENKKHVYEDFCLCPKYKINKFLSKNYWEGVISGLSEI